MKRRPRRVRTDSTEYFANVLASGHGSVLEHANFSFAFRNVSRVATHEIVRHRAGAAYSQESLRYVRLADIGFRVPPALEPLRNRCIEIVEQLEEFQVDAAEQLALDDDGRILGLRGEVIHDGGAYLPMLGVVLPYITGSTVPGPYVIPAFDLTVKVACTNMISCSPVRGAGRGHPGVSG